MLASTDSQTHSSAYSYTNDEADSPTDPSTDCKTHCSTDSQTHSSAHSGTNDETYSPTDPSTDCKTHCTDSEAYRISDVESEFICSVFAAVVFSPVIFAFLLPADISANLRKGVLWQRSKARIRQQLPVVP